MSYFEDNLWDHIVSSFADDLEKASAPVAKRRRALPYLVGGAAAGLLGAGTAATLALSVVGSTPAYAVSDHGGSVTVALNSLSGLAGANQKLSALGVRARAVQLPAGCKVSFLQAQFDPGKIPAGKTLVLAAFRTDSQVRLSSAQIDPNGAVVCKALNAARALAGKSGGATLGPAGAPPVCLVTGPKPALGNFKSTGNSGTGNSGTGNSGPFPATSGGNGPVGGAAAGQVPASSLPPGPAGIVARRTAAAMSNTGTGNSGPGQRFVSLPCGFAAAVAFPPGSGVTGNS